MLKIENIEEIEVNICKECGKMYVVEEECETCKECKDKRL